MQTNLLKQFGPFSEITNNIEVCVVPEFDPAQSRVEDSIFTYSYTVTMRNIGETSAQLVNRHWMVLSAERQIADVKGEGVVGEQPVLDPNHEYTYKSWTTVLDPVGAMLGNFTFCSEEGEFFDVVIPRFELIYLDQEAVH